MALSRVRTPEGLILLNKIGAPDIQVDETVRKFVKAGYKWKNPSVTKPVTKKTTGKKNTVKKPKTAVKKAVSKKAAVKKRTVSVSKKPSKKAVSGKSVKKPVTKTTKKKVTKPTKKSVTGVKK